MPHHIHEVSGDQHQAAPVQCRDVYSRRRSAPAHTAGFQTPFHWYPRHDRSALWLINRLPYSAHVDMMEDTGFRIVGEQLVRRSSNVKRRQLAAQFRWIPDRDLTTTDAFVQAVKPVLS